LGLTICVAMMYIGPMKRRRSARLARPPGDRPASPRRDRPVKRPGERKSAEKRGKVPKKNKKTARLAANIKPTKRTHPAKLTGYHQLPPIITSRRARPPFAPGVPALLGAPASPSPCLLLAQAGFFSIALYEQLWFRLTERWDGTVPRNFCWPCCWRPFAFGRS